MRKYRNAFAKAVSEAAALLLMLCALGPFALAEGEGGPALSLDRRTLALCLGDAPITLTAIFTPEDAAAPLVWASSDESVATVDGSGAVTAVALGAADITAATGDGSLSAVCSVAVKPDRIASSVYTIDRSSGLLPDVRKFTPPDLFLANFGNAADLSILDRDGKTYDGKFVGTGATVALSVNGILRDSLKVVVLGDVSGDGAISIIDYSLARLDILGQKKLTNEYFLAGDVDKDGKISVLDYSLMRLDLLGYKLIGGSGTDFSGVTDPRINAFLECLLAQQGKPYTWGANGPDSFDCSGLVYYCLNKIGYKVGRMSAAGYSKNSAWQYVPKGSLQAGDLLFFFESKPSEITHVGIYLGDGKLINASMSYGSIIICPLTGWYVNNLSHARRVFY
jgi:hypothetical protein